MMWMWSVDVATCKCSILSVVFLFSWWYLYKFNESSKVFVYTLWILSSWYCGCVKNNYSQFEAVTQLWFKFMLMTQPTVFFLLYTSIVRDFNFPIEVRIEISQTMNVYLKGYLTYYLMNWMVQHLTKPGNFAVISPEIEENLHIS